MVEQLSDDASVDRIFALSRGEVVSQHDKVTAGHIDLADETSIEAAARRIEEKLDAVIVTSGILHDQDGLRPEKSLRQLSANNMLKVLTINTMGPALAGRHFAGLLKRDQRSVFAALSARVGSIGDNRLGGWYSYRASKAALNMVLKTMAIEMRRTHPTTIVAGLHPGTVDTALSKPFQRNVPEGKLFDRARAARQLLDVIDALDPEDSRQVFDWAGKRIAE